MQPRICGTHTTSPIIGSSNRLRLAGFALTIFALFATFGLLGTVLAAPASAAAPWAGCVHGEICLSDHINGGGAQYSSTNLANPDLHNNGMGDRASAAWNRTRVSIFLYYHRGSANSQRCVVELTPYGRPVNLPGAPADEISQYGYLYNYQGPCYFRLG